MERRDCTGASTRAKGSAQILRDTETHPAGDDDGGGDLDALLGEVEVELRRAKGQRTEGRSRPRSLREVRAVLQGIRDGTLLVEPVESEEDRPGSRRRGRWADEAKVKNRPAWGKLRAQTAMTRRFRVVGVSSSARLVWLLLWTRGSGLQDAGGGRACVEVGHVLSGWLAAEAALSERTVRNALRELEEAGMLARTRTTRGYRYRCMVPADLVAQMGTLAASTEGDEDAVTGNDFRSRPEVTSGVTGKKRPLDTPEPPDPSFQDGDGGGERTAAAGAGSEEPPRSGEGSDGVCPIALRRSLLIGAGVWPRVAATVASLPGVVAMPVEDLRAEIALAREDGAAPGALLVARLKQRDRLARRDRGSKTKPPAPATREASTGSSWSWCSAEDAARIASDADRWAKRGRPFDPLNPIASDDAVLCWSILGDAVHLAGLGLDEAGSATGFRDRIAGDALPEAFVDHAARIVEADPEAFEAMARSWRSRIDAARATAGSTTDHPATRHAAEHRAMLLDRESAIALGDWFRARWRKPPAPKRDAQAPAEPIEPIADTRRRCPSDVRPKPILLPVEPLVAAREEEEAKAAGTWSRFATPRAVSIVIEPGGDLSAVAIAAADEKPDPAAVMNLLSKWSNSARTDKHEKRVVVEVLAMLRDELARRRRLEPPTRNPVEVLRALQATGDPPIARIADGEVVEAGENVITTPKRKRSRTA